MREVLRQTTTSVELSLTKETENWAFFKHKNKTFTFLQKAIKKTMLCEITAIPVNLLVMAKKKVVWITIKCSYFSYRYWVSGRKHNNGLFKNKKVIFHQKKFSVKEEISSEDVPTNIYKKAAGPCCCKKISTTNLQSPTVHFVVWW